MMPIRDETLSGVPVATSIPKTPTNESGAAERIISAGRKARNCTTSTVKTAASASPSTPSNWLKDCLLRFVLSPNLIGHARGELDAAHHLLNVGDGAAQIAIFEARGQRDHQSLILAEELVFTQHAFHGSDRAERHHLFRRA